MKNNPKLSDVKDSFAVILCGIIKSDGVVSDIEREKFNNFFKKEFNSTQEEIDTLFKNAINQTDYDKHITILKEAFTNTPMQMMQFMQYLNETIISDGIGEDEYKLFERVRDGLV